MVESTEKRKISVSILMSLLISLLVFAGCSKSSTNTESNAKEQKELITSVKVLELKRSDITTYLSYSGSLNPYEEVKINPKKSGTISRIFVKEGDIVKKGQVVVEFDKIDAEISVKLAKANLEFAKSNLNVLLAGTREEKIQEAKAIVSKAEADVENANKDLERMKRLYSSGAVPQKTLDAVQTQVKVAEANLKAVKEQLTMAVKGPTQEDIDVAKARVKQAEVGLEQAEQNLKDMIITSPINGVVVSKIRSEGEFATHQPITDILHLTDISRVKVDIEVIEKEIAKIKLGKEALIEVDSFPGILFKGKVSTIIPSANPLNRTFNVKIEIPNPDLKLKPGMFVRARTVDESRGKALIIPAYAMLDKNGDKYVFVAKGDSAEQRIVKSGVRDGDRVEIISGLKEGELLIIEGQGNLEDKSRIKY